MSKVDQELQNMAISNWAAFITLVGKDALITAKAKLLREQGMTYNQICTKLNISMMQARHACKKRKVR